MTELHEVAATTLDASSSPESTLETPSRTHVLITAPEVAFSTAAASPVQRSTTRWWIMATRVVAVAVHRMFLTTAEPRRRYMDDAVMARQMHRL
jgi:hypothetical protein